MSPELKLDDIEQLEAWVAEQVRDSLEIDLRDHDSKVENWSELADTTESISYLAKVRIDPPALPEQAVRARVRIFDLVVSILLAILLLPIVLLIAVSIKLSSRGPIVVRDIRIGRSGVPFYCYKFRSSESNDPSTTTAVGRLLTRTDFDELPQLWNVIRGEMSLVGPRPVHSDEAELYEDNLSSVLSVHPGMTGRWQISRHQSLDYSDRVQLDVEYVGSRTVAGDFRICLKTAVQLLRPATYHGDEV